MELKAQPSHICRKRPPLTQTPQKTPFQMGYKDIGILGAPLFELESVEISGPSLHQICAGAGAGAGAGAVQVHGQITLIDDLGNQFSLFSRNQRDRLLINLHSSPLNIGRDKLGDARCLPGYFWLDFQLNLQGGDTEEHAVEEFNEFLFIDCTTHVTYDKLQQSSVSNSNLQVCVRYMIFGCAALARPGFVVEKIQKTDDDDDDSDIRHVVDSSGSIDYCYQMSNLSWMTLRLFGEAQKLELGDFIEGPTLAVPAYSTPSFALDLHVNGEHFVYAHDTLAFDDASHGITYEKQLQGQKYLISLIFYRNAVINELPESTIREWCNADTESSLTETIMKNPYNKRPRSQVDDQPIYIQPHLLSLNNRFWIVSSGPEELAEIFSISICSYNVQSSSLSLKGTILGYDFKKKLNLFEGGIVHPDDIVKLASFGRCFIGWFFGIVTHLEDDDGREISRGYAAYSEANVDGWFDRRLCSVIRGKYGYAAVHYSIFQDAVEATIKFRLVSNFSSTRGGYEVCGEISTRYNNMRYATHYEKKYYQSRLFEKRDSEAVMLEKDEIPLSKSAVAVPMNSSLIVVGNINVMVKGKLLDSFKLEEIFPAEKPLTLRGIVNESKEIDGSKLSLFVHVEWGYQFAQN